MLVLVLGSGLGGGLMRAQTPPAPKAPAAATGQGVVLEHSRTRIIRNADGTGTTEFTATLQIQSQAGVAAEAVLAFPYVRNVQTLDIVSVRVRQPQGAVVLTPAANIEDMPGAVTQAAPMYSDLREKHVVVKGLDVGDTLVYDVRWTMVHPQWPGQFWINVAFPATLVSPDEELEIEVPSNLAVQIASPGLKPQQEQAGAHTIYHWKYARTADATAPPPKVAVTTLKSWAQVGAWYWGLAEPQQAPTPAIRAKAAALTQGLTSDQAKIEATYKFVANHIHYVALNFGNGDYQPHSAEAVLENGYGDCKDQQTLLAALLSAEGYQAWPALINSSGAKLLTDAPSPAQFDHVITVVPRGGGKQDWLDTTPGVAPYGMLMANLRDQQALVIPSNAAAALATTPADPPFPSDVHFDAQGTLDAHGTLTAHVNESLRGDRAVLLRRAFRIIPAAQWPKLMQAMARDQGFGGKVSDAVVSAPEDTSSPEHWSFDYSRSNYGDWADQATSAFLPPLVLALPDQAPANPIFLGAPGTRTYRSRISLPAGYTPELPKPVDLASDWLDYRAAYTFAGGVLTSDRTMVVKKDQAPPAAFAELSKFGRAVAADISTTIPLDAAAGGGNVRALLEAGAAALNSREFSVAIQKLQQVVKLRPRDPQAWTMLGWAYGSDLRLDEAVHAFQTEIGINPDSPEAQRGLAIALSQQGKRAQALALLRQVVKTHPGDAPAQQTLSELEKPGSGARLAVGAPGLAAGENALKAGDYGKAIPALNQAVVADPTPGRMIAVAHLLADSGQDLNQARQYAASAVPTLEVLLHGASLDKQPKHELAETALLAGGWSTQGWIAFQQGDLAAAADDLNAAWRLAHSVESAEQLGQVYQKLGRRTDAERLYADAVAVGPLGAEGRARARLEALAGKAKAADLISEQRGAVSRSRMVEIPAQHLQPGTAQFFISFDPGSKVDAVKFDTGDASLRPAAAVLAEAHFNVIFPKNATTTLVRNGMLDCEPAATSCDFVLMPLPSLNAALSTP